MIYAAPGTAGATIAFKAQYNNFIGGKFVAPVKGQYFDVITPTTGKVYTQAARSTSDSAATSTSSKLIGGDRRSLTAGGTTGATPPYSS